VLIFIIDEFRVNTILDSGDQPLRHAGLIFLCHPEFD